ncbi:hypothetical protein TrRE_jg11371 [Triparma retinervis]|uniref:Secreted protein n=1 Tax=Triparma retinervis TaxID=2557542 RepID=A0A9W7ABY2_9STRA|nr:hypothetical protein TrRE_jg11371 [Triparma retinervis]
MSIPAPARLAMVWALRVSWTPLASPVHDKEWEREGGIKGPRRGREERLEFVANIRSRPVRAMEKGRYLERGVDDLFDVSKFRQADREPMGRTK